MNTVAARAPSTDWQAGAWEPAGLQRVAVRALHYELVCAPKPGLVTPTSRGSHDDMDAGTLFRGLASQRRYYVAAARAGAAGAEFEELRQLGLAAERRMLRATGGINTHRGAIFSLGLLTAAAARAAAVGGPVDSTRAAALVRDTWGGAIAGSRADAPASHGTAVLARYGAGGARIEAAAGFPTVLGTVLPALRFALRRGATTQAAAVQALFAAIATLEDTNLLHRGGEAGLAFARDTAAEFLARGGVLRPGWRRQAEEIADAFVERRLSPGGSADALAIALWCWQLDRTEEGPEWA